MKLIRRILMILTVFIILFMFIPNNMYISKAADVANIVKGTGDDISNPELTTNLTSIINQLLGFIQVASAIIGVIVIAFTGFNYIIAETPEIKEELKRKMLPMIIGLILIFGASSIMTFILQVVGE